MDRLVFLHGFSQTHHHWHRPAHLVAERLGTSPTLAFVDLPGHGLARDDRDGDIDSVGPRLVDVAGPGTYVGYSMGGRIALVAAATGAAAIDRLVLIGATPGIADDDDRADRIRQDEQRAGHLEEVGLDAFLEEWLALPMFAGLPPDPTGLALRRDNTVDGLTHSLRSYGTGVQTPVWDRLDSIDVPTLVMAGALDTKFVDIGRRLAAGLPRADFTTIPDAGHAAHLERPSATATVIADWLTARSA